MSDPFANRARTPSDPAASVFDIVPDDGADLAQVTTALNVLTPGTVRVTSDATNKTLGFGIFYAMVNIGGSFGPIVAARLRAISWNYAFLAAAIAIGVMLVITILFYKEPPREREGGTLGQKLRGIDRKSVV